MLYLIAILALFVGGGIYLLTRKTVAPPVVTTSEDEKLPSWMDNPNSNPDAYISAQVSSLTSASIAAQSSLQSSLSQETSVAGTAKRKYTKKSAQ